MADNFLTISLDGYDQFQLKLSGLSDRVMQEVDGETKAAADQWVELAVGSAPGDTGNLRRNIRAQQLGQANYQITSEANYSPFVEWGTINYVAVPQALTEYASQFKGKGLRRNGGMKPQPFFFVHRDTVVNNWIERIKAILETEH